MDKLEEARKFFNEIQVEDSCTCLNIVSYDQVIELKRLYEEVISDILK